MPAVGANIFSCSCCSCSCCSSNCSSCLFTVQCCRVGAEAVLALIDGKPDMVACVCCSCCSRCSHFIVVSLCRAAEWLLRQYLVVFVVVVVVVVVV